VARTIGFNKYGEYRCRRQTKNTDARSKLKTGAGGKLKAEAGGKYRNISALKQQHRNPIF